MKNYKIQIYWSDEDEVWIFEVEGLLGCLAHGKTEWEALKEGSIALELYLEAPHKYNNYGNP